jgi:hypothetical protein
LFTSSLLLFAFLFVITLWAGLPPIQHLAESIRFYKTDQYFLSGAGPFKAVDEWSAIFYGRLLSLVVTTLPGSLGIFCFFVAGCLVARPLSSWETQVFGGATLATLVIAAFATRIRMFHPYTSYLPFFLTASVAFIRWAVKLIPSRAGRAVLLSLFLVVSLGQCFYYLSLVPGYSKSISRVDRLFRDYHNKSILAIVFPDQKYKGQRLRDDAGDEIPILFEERVANEQPQYVLLFSSYFLNMCKYRHSELYKKNCAYFHDLIEGKTNYQLRETIDIDIGKAFAIDPEIRDMGIYFLEKRI